MLKGGLIVTVGEQNVPGGAEFRLFLQNSGQHLPCLLRVGGQPFRAAIPPRQHGGGDTTAVSALPVKLAGSHVMLAPAAPDHRAIHRKLRQEHRQLGALAEGVGDVTHGHPASHRVAVRHAQQQIAGDGLCADH